MPPAYIVHSGVFRGAFSQAPWLTLYTVVYLGGHSVMPPAYIVHSAVFRGAFSQAPWLTLYTVVYLGGHSVRPPGLHCTQWCI